MKVLIKLGGTLLESGAGRAAIAGQLAAVPGFDQETIDAVLAAAEGERAAREQAAADAQAQAAAEPEADGGNGDKEAPVRDEQ